MQFFGIEDIKDLTKVSNTVVRLESGSLFRIGGQAYSVGQLDLDTSVSGVGGLELSVQAYELYYVYVVLDSGSPAIIGSTSNIGPSGYLAYKKVGAFRTNGSSEIVSAIIYGSDDELVKVIARKTTEQDLSDNDAVTINFDDKIEDNYNAYNSTTGVFNCPKISTYIAGYNIFYQGLDPDQHTVILSINDGVASYELHRSRASSGLSDTNVNTQSFQFKCNSLGQEIRFRALCNNVDNTEANTRASVASVYFNHLSISEIPSKESELDWKQYQ